MISKNELKYIQSLSRKKNRDEEQLFIAEGAKVVSELLEAGFSLKKIYGTEEWINKYNPPVSTTANVTEEELSKISLLQTPNQVLAIAIQPKNTKEPVLKNNLTLVLDGIQDPGNLGTIIRIADWFGITQIVASHDTVELYNPKVIQSTMGSFIRTRVWYKDLPDFLQQADVPIYGALLEGKNIKQFHNISEGILIIGNESKGIREAVKPLVQHAVSIARIGNAESLNAAVATGILLSHMTE